MTLFIQSDGGSAGSGSVFPERASSHLIAIANLDAGYGETPGPASNLIQVTYARTETGACPQRLDLLVNTDFSGTVGNIDILVVAADTNFTLNDGSMLGGGFNIPPNTMAGSVNLNPTDSTLVIYDTSDNGGTGICLQREGGGLDLESPGSVILYHELSHALRTCTSASLDRTETDCANASDEEAAAIVDENDMRDQLGIGRRQPDNHCGSLGCQSTCCIVASVACGSPFANEVNALRETRDRKLRKSEVGFDFFERLHRDYYQFSPRVVDMMGSDAALRTFVRIYFVRPLIAALELIHEHTAEHASPRELAQMLEASVRQWPEILALPGDDLATLQAMISNAPVSTNAVALLPGSQPTHLGELGALLEARSMSSVYVKWALSDVLRIFVRCLEWRKAGILDDGRRIAAAIDEWSGEMPISEVWSTLSRHEVLEELEFLRNTLLREPSAQERFVRRLIEAFPENVRVAEVASKFVQEGVS